MFFSYVVACMHDTHNYMHRHFYVCVASQLAIPQQTIIQYNSLYVCVFIEADQWLCVCQIPGNNVVRIVDILATCKIYSPLHQERIKFQVL